jgi:hypothetical protein
VAAAADAVDPRPDHDACVAAVFAVDTPAAISWWEVSVTQTVLLASTAAGEPASKVAAMVSGGPVQRGSLGMFVA